MVHPDYQNNGYGANLLKTAVQPVNGVYDWIIGIICATIRCVADVWESRSEYEQLQTG